MTIPRKNTLLCATLTTVLATLLIQGAAFAEPLKFDRGPGSSSQASAGSNNSAAGNYSAVPSQIGQAQQATARALTEVTIALSVNWAGKTHAVTAKALLEQANQELKLANTKISAGTNTSSATSTGK
jgi:hypothetical protein